MTKGKSSGRIGWVMWQRVWLGVMCSATAWNIFGCRVDVAGDDPASSSLPDERRGFSQGALDKNEESAWSRRGGQIHTEACFFRSTTLDADPVISAEIVYWAGQPGRSRYALFGRLGNRVGLDGRNAEFFAFGGQELVCHRIGCDDPMSQQLYLDRDGVDSYSLRWKVADFAGPGLEGVQIFEFEAKGDLSGSIYCRGRRLLGRECRKAGDGIRRVVQRVAATRRGFDLDLSRVTCN